MLFPKIEFGNCGVVGAGLGQALGKIKIGAALFIQERNWSINP